jgi:hypothetical protein
VVAEVDDEVSTSGGVDVEPGDGAAGEAQNLSSVRKAAAWMVEDGGRCGE